MEHNDIVITLQETKLTSRSNISTLNHSIVRQDRERNKGGGIDFLVHKELSFSVIDLPTTPIQQDHVEQQAGNSTLTLVNLYIPPKSSCPQGSSCSIEHIILEQEYELVMGDLNAHHSLLNSDLNEDIRGTDIANQISDSTYGLAMHPCQPEYQAIPQVHPTSPLFAPLSYRQPGCKTALSCDPLPIIIELQREIVKTRATQISWLQKSPGRIDD